MDSGSEKSPNLHDVIFGMPPKGFIHLLQVHFGAEPDSFHIIGHSLGAHIAGYVGERLLAIEAEGRGGGGKLGQPLIHKHF